MLLEGVVQAQCVRAVEVDWLYAHACDPAALPSPLPLTQLVPLDHYAHLMTLVGDRVSLAPAVLAAAASGGAAALASLSLSCAERVAHVRSLASCAEVLAVHAAARVRWQDGELSAPLDTATLREPLAAELAAQTWQCGALVQRADRDDDARYTVAATRLDDGAVTLCALGEDAPQEHVDATALLGLAHEQPRVAGTALTLSLSHASSAQLPLTVRLPEIA